MRECPLCHSLDIHRSRTRSAIERVIVWVKARHLYRCRACGYRGWETKRRARPVGDMWIPTGTPPDLSQLDRIVVPEATDDSVARSRDAEA